MFLSCPSFYTANSNLSFFWVHVALTSEGATSNEQRATVFIIMEGLGSDGAASVMKWKSDFSRKFQYYLDKSTPNTMERWLGTLAVAAIYVLRVFYVQGFYIVTYGLGIYILNLLIGFLSPSVDPELEALNTASLPTKGSDEFKPFVRRLPEFKFW